MSIPVHHHVWQNVYHAATPAGKVAYIKVTGQVEASQLVGIGKIAFSRYERGETQAHAPLVKRLRLVDQHPELLGEVGAL